MRGGLRKRPWRRCCSDRWTRRRLHLLSSLLISGASVSGASGASSCRGSSGYAPDALGVKGVGRKAVVPSSSHQVHRPSCPRRPVWAILRGCRPSARPRWCPDHRIKSQLGEGSTGPSSPPYAPGCVVLSSGAGAASLERSRGGQRSGPWHLSSVNYPSCTSTVRTCSVL